LYCLVPAVLARSLNNSNSGNTGDCQNIGKGNHGYIYTDIVPRMSWMDNSNKNSMFFIGLNLSAYKMGGIFWRLAGIWCSTV